MINEIVLRRKNKITIPERIMAIVNNPDFPTSHDDMVVIMMKNIESLGFTFDQELFNTLRYFTKRELTDFYSELIPILKAMKGADVEYYPMYPNFPRQVVEMDDIELFVNAIIHYWSFGTLMPDYEKDERFPLMDSVDLTKLTIGTTDDMWDIFSNLLSSKTSISDKDREDLYNIIREFPDYTEHLPEEIPMKENIAFLCNTILSEEKKPNGDAVKKYFKTATDVLRLITAMSDGDISLAKNTKYKHFTRPERRFIMDLLAGCGSIKEDMFRNKDRWIRIGEILHPVSYRSRKYKTVKEAFDAIRNNEKPLFFGGKVNQLIQEGRIYDAGRLLANRPGEFARQIDKFLRECDNPNYVVNCFATVADKVSAPILLNLRQHFINRKDENIRVVIPKGMTSKAYTIPSQPKTIDEKVCQNMVKVCEKAIIEQNRSKDYLGNVFIDEEMKNYMVPFSQRSASTATKTLVRGSRVKVPDNAKAVRGFIWWTNTEHERVDIDLSASIYDENWEFLQHVGWTNLRSQQFECYHSGDITNGGKPDGKGVAEFIDFNLEQAAKYGRYVVFSVHSFTMQPFDRLENCRFGWMTREDVDSGEIFEPSTVEMSIDLNAVSRMAIPVIFDCKTREFVWCDLATNTRIGSRGNAIECNLEGAHATCYAITNIKKTSMYDAVMLNAKARGCIVDSRDDADIIFSNDTTKPVDRVVNEDGDVISETERDIPIITAYDLDYYMSEIL